MSEHTQVHISTKSALEFVFDFGFGGDFPLPVPGLPPQPPQISLLSGFIFLFLNPLSPTFHFGLGLSQPLLELLLEEEGLQALLVVVYPVDREAASQAAPSSPGPGPGPSFRSQTGPSTACLPLRPSCHTHGRPAHFIEEAVSTGHPLDLMLVLLKEVNVTLLRDELEELERASEGQTGSW